MLRLPITVLASAAVWILLVAGVKPEEMIVGGICVLLTVWFVYYVAKHECPRFRLRFRDWIQIWRLPAYLISGSWEVLSVLVMDLLHLAPAQSLFRSAPFECNPDEPVDVARRVLAIAYTTATPNFIIIGIDVPGRQMLFHQLKKSEVLPMTRRLGAQA